jgi:hypothetical protein
MPGMKTAITDELITALEEAGIERNPMVFDGIQHKLNEADMWELRDIILNSLRYIKSS